MQKRMIGRDGYTYWSSPITAWSILPLFLLLFGLALRHPQLFPHLFHLLQKLGLLLFKFAIQFLACARIGAIHSVVFAGFSAESLRGRVRDCASRVLITTDEGRRGGKTIATKAIVDAALKECPLVEHVLVLKRTGNTVPWTAGRDKWWHEEIAKVPRFCPPEIMSAEDPLFILYVSRLPL